MRRAVIGLLAGLAGCDQVFGLERPDAYVEPIKPLIISPDADSDDDGDSNGADLCPQIPKTMPGGALDRDGDGVGDLCDPAPDAAEDCLMLFDDFSVDTALAPQWQVDGKPFFFELGHLAIDTQSIAFLSVPTAVTSLEIDGYIPIGTGAARGIQLFVDLTRSPLANGTACAAQQRAGEPSQVAIVDVVDGVDSSPAPTQVGSLPVGAGTNLTLRWASKELPGQCHASFEANGITQAAGTGGVPPRSGTVAIRTSGDVRFNLRGIIGYGKFCAPAP